MYPRDMINDKRTLRVWFFMNHPLCRKRAIFIFCWYFAQSGGDSFVEFFTGSYVDLVVRSSHHFLSFSTKLASSSYRLQGHEGRSVQFKTCVEYFNFYASCKLHRPAFMTLGPIRWHCKFCWELRNDEYNNNINLIRNNTTWHEIVTNLAEMNNFWRFWRNVDQYRSGLQHPLLSMQ